MKRNFGTFLVLTLCLFQASPVLARSDDVIREEIEAELAALETLQETQIKVHVEERLVILTGNVRFYEQKLISERVAWTTPGIYEVDNEIQVEPIAPLSDPAIKQAIWKIVKANERFRASALEVTVREGRVTVDGTFVGFSDPSLLKHKVAEIEGVIDIEMIATFVA